MRQPLLFGVVGTCLLVGCMTKWSQKAEEAAKALRIHDPGGDCGVGRSRMGG